MANYIKATNFRIKDSLVTGDPNKRIKGAEIDDEFVGIATAISSKADSASPSFTGTPSAPTAPPGNNSTQLATTAFVFQNSVPIGAILMWSGLISAIPSGYALCDGTSGTPDLRNRFIIGAGSSYSVGSTGGSADAVVVSHTHTEQATPPSYFDIISRDTGESITATTGLLRESVSPNANFAFANGNIVKSYERVNLDPHTHAINTTGESGVGKNLPPYYALAFIQRVS